MLLGCMPLRANSSSDSGQSAINPALDAALRLAARAPDSPLDSCVLEGEADEDETPDAEIVASPARHRPTSNHHAALLERAIAVAPSRMLVSTGLGRGPPLG
jgi:hypothetical protein